MYLQKVICCIFLLFSITKNYGQQNLDSLISIANKTLDSEAKLNAYTEIVKATLYSNYDSALAFSQRYRAFAMQTNNRKESARGLNYIGMCYHVKGYYARSIEYYTQALSEFEAMQDTFMTAMMYNNIAAAYQYREKADETIEYYNKALEKFKLLKDEQWIASVSNNLAAEYQKKKELNHAFELFQLADSLFTILGDNLYVGYSNLGLANCLYEMEKPTEALEYYKSALSLIDPKQDLQGVSTAHNDLCLCYSKLGMMDSAQVHCDKALQIAEQLDVMKERRDAYRNNMLLNESLGNYKEAYHFSQRYVQYKDSLYSREKDEMMLSVLEEYDSEKKDQQLALNALDLLQKDGQRKMYLAFTCLALLLLAAAVYFALSKMRNNRKLGEKNTIIQKALEDKEILLREIHHRVKNNLQVVSSLLSIQSREIVDEKALEAVNESRNRVKSMALIHQNLYSEENLTGIDVGDYIRKLSESLFNSYKVDKDEIVFETDIDKLNLDVDTTIPLGLILNELITNALKYAFVNSDNPKLLVSLKETSEGLKLEVSDNGVGYNPENARKDSFGMKMIEAFAQKLNARWEVKNENGTVVTMIIKSYKKAA